MFRRGRMSLQYRPRPGPIDLDNRKGPSVIRVLAIVVCALAVSYAGGATAHATGACTDSWATATSGSWATASAWSANRVPLPTDDVCITVAGTYTVTLAPIGSAGGQTVNLLTLGGGSGTQTLDVVGASSVSTSNETQNTTALALTSGGSISATGSLLLDATAGGTPTQGGAVGGDAVLISYKALTNAGHIQTQVEDKSWQVYFSGTLVNSHSGSLTVASGSFSLPSPSTSGFGGANVFAVTNAGSLTVARGATMAMAGGLGSSGSFANSGTIKDLGTLLATTSGGPMAWTESGSEQGEPVILENGASLADSKGPGQFLFNQASGYLTGTIPATQTITVRGNNYSYQGEEYYTTILTLNNAQSKARAVVNRGTVILDSPGHGQKSGGSAGLTAGTLLNYGRVIATVEDSSFSNSLKVGLVNEHSGTVTVKSGQLQQTGTTPTTNHGLVTVAPGALWVLDEGSTFTNARNGTVAVQIASKVKLGAFQLSAPCCAGAGKMTAGGTLAPKLLRHYRPAAGSSFELFQLVGGQFAGTFSMVSGGFRGDYSHETATPAYAGVILGAAGKKKKG